MRVGQLVELGKGAQREPQRATRVEREDRRALWRTGWRPCIDEEVERGRQLRPRQVGEKEEEARKGLSQRQQELRAGALSTQVATLTGRDEDRHAGTSMEGKLQVELAAVARVPPVRRGARS